MSEDRCGCCGNPANACFCVIDNEVGNYPRSTAPDLICRTHDKIWFAKLANGEPGWVKA